MPSRIRQTQAQGEFPATSFRDSPLEQIRTLYAGFCQGLFAAAPPGTYRWAPTLEQTEIVITDESPVHVDTIGKRPAISFTRGPVQSYSLGQDDMLTYDFETGKKKKSILVPGTMSINCCSRVDLESERLAWIVAEQLWLHRELLMKAGFFEIGRQFIVGSPSPAGSLVTGDSGDEWVVTTVSSPFQFYRTSQFTPLGAPILQGISLQFSSSRYSSGGAVGAGSATTGNTGEQGAATGEDGIERQGVSASTVIRVRGAGIRPPAIGGRTIPIQ